MVQQTLAVRGVDDLVPERDACCAATPVSSTGCSGQRSRFDHESWCQYYVGYDKERGTPEGGRLQ